MSYGPRQGKVKQSQRGESGLHAVGQSPGAAEPREPRAQVAEELQVRVRKLHLNRHALESDSVLANCRTGKILTVHLATSRLSSVRMRKKNFTSAHAASRA